MYLQSRDFDSGFDSYKSKGNFQKLNVSLNEAKKKPLQIIDSQGFRNCFCGEGGICAAASGFAHPWVFESKAYEGGLTPMFLRPRTFAFKSKLLTLTPLYAKNAALSCGAFLCFA